MCGGRYFDGAGISRSGKGIEVRIEAFQNQDRVRMRPDDNAQ